MSTIDEEILERSLPVYLREDIASLLEGSEQKSSLLDYLYCEVQGSINSALYGNVIASNKPLF